MPGSSTSDDPLLPAEALVPVAGEIVHEQTVRAYVPAPPSTETTVKVPIPTAPVHEQTVRAWFPTPPPAQPKDEALDPLEEPEVEDVEEVDELEVEAEEVEAEEVEAVELEPERPSVDVSALVLELEADVGDVPVVRPDQPTVPEAVAKPRPKPSLRRQDPPAVSGEVAVVEPEPSAIFGPSSSAPRSRMRGDTAPAGRARAGHGGGRRDDPPSVSGEVAVDPTATASPEVPRAADVYVMPMTASGSNPVMTSSGPNPVMTASGSNPVMTASGSNPVMTSSGPSPVMVSRTSSDPSGFAVSGPQRRRSGEITGPQTVLASRARARDSIVLWSLAGALVVLALGMVMVVISWVQ